MPESPRSTVSRRPSPSASGLATWVSASSASPATTTPATHAVARRLAEGVARDEQGDHACLRSRSASAAAMKRDSRVGRCGVTARTCDARLEQPAQHVAQLRLVLEPEDRLVGALGARDQARPVLRQLEQRPRRAADLDGLRAALHQLAHRGHSRQAAADQDRDAVAQHLDVRQDVRREQHGHAALALLGDEIAHVAAPERVEPAHGLVQDEQLGIVHQRGRQPQALQHALRVLAQSQARPLAQPDASEPVARALAARSRRADPRAARPARGTRRRSGSRRSRAARAGSRGRGARPCCSTGSPSSQALSARGLQQAGEELERGGLARRRWDRAVPAPRRGARRGPERRAPASPGASRGARSASKVPGRRRPGRGPCQSVPRPTGQPLAGLQSRRSKSACSLHVLIPSAGANPLRHRIRPAARSRPRRRAVPALQRACRAAWRTVRYATPGRWRWGPGERWAGAGPAEGLDGAQPPCPAGAGHPAAAARSVPGGEDERDRAGLPVALHVVRDVVRVRVARDARGSCSPAPHSCPGPPRRRRCPSSR